MRSSSVTFLEQHRVMIILLTGITGFIGSHLAPILRQAGHSVRGTHRGPDGPGLLHADFSRDVDAAIWVPRLRGVDLVINAVGILRETRGQRFAPIHTQAPQALFRACEMVGMSRVIQISALGADTARGGYFASKHAADEMLAGLALEWAIVQPSLVFAPDGTSARLFAMLATLPIIPLPGRGRQCVQPIHIDDLTQAITQLCTHPGELRSRVPLVGPRPISLVDMLQQIRGGLGLSPALTLTVPISALRPAARLIGQSEHSLLSAETLSMLEAGNTAEPAWTARLLERAPRPIAEFIEKQDRAAMLTAGRLAWLLPLLRVTIALVWIWTGIVSLGLYPPQLSLQLLERSGVPRGLQPLMLYGAAVLDLALGLATLALPRRRSLWLGQMALILLYSVIITLRLPEYWLHPYGPMIKNLPMLAAIYCLHVLEQPGSSRSHSNA
jgi:uncharacterized protein YbjT (DUF2867 family)